MSLDLPRDSVVLTN